MKLKLVFIFPILILNSCLYESNVRELDSGDYSTKEERVEVLKKEIKSFSNFEDAVFELFNVNGFSNSRRTVPGASSWDYRFVIKVSPENIDKWIDGMIEMKPSDYDRQWMKEIIRKQEYDWKVNTEPEFYIRKGNNVMLIVHRSEGIVFKRVTGN